MTRRDSWKRLGVILAGGAVLPASVNTAVAQPPLDSVCLSLKGLTFEQWKAVVAALKPVSGLHADAVADRLFVR